MTREQATQEVKSRWKEYLIPAKKNGYKCPLCGNGTGESGDGLSENPRNPNNFKCFKCDFYGDIIDLIGAEYDLSSSDKFNKAYELFGLNIDENNNPSKSLRSPYNNFISKGQKELNNTTPPRSPLEAPRKDLTCYVTNCIKNLKEEEIALKYCRETRGLSLNTIEKFNLGYDIDKKAIVIPYLPKPFIYYIHRSIDDNSKLKHIKPKSSEVGQEPIFNYILLEKEKKLNKPLFVVESPLCAISFLEANNYSIALGGTGYQRLIDILKEKGVIPNILYISLDNDDAGKKTTEKLVKELEEIKQPYKIFNISGFYKDPNECLVKDRNLFIDNIKKAELDYKELKGTIKEKELKLITKYKNENSTAGFIPEFKSIIKNSAKNNTIATSFSEIDDLLDGGLYSGLYIIGAISSLGKTTFSLQVADSIAESGKDVLFFSLEMSKSEIISKSISRETMKQGNTSLAKTTRGIMTGKKYAQYSEKEKSVINTAIDKYTQYGANMYIFEGLGNIGVNDVRETIKKHIEVTGHTPVVFIDYLQILAPYDIRATDKQNTDKAVLELKQLSRDLNLTVFAISSFNRENYINPVNTASFKESGAIEYSSDVLIGLQYNGMDYSDGELEKDRKSRVSKLIKTNSELANKGKPISIDVKVLKNRNGRKGSIKLDFYPMFNYFTKKSDFVPCDEDSPFEEDIQRF